MQKLFVAIIALAIISCNSKDKKEGETKDKTAVALNMSGYTADYSTSFETGDPKNMETILNLWKMWTNGTWNPVNHFLPTAFIFIFVTAA